MKVKITLFATLLSSIFVFGQKLNEIKPPSSFFPKNKAQVLVVGSFHFDYPNLDIVKTGDNDKVDVLTEPKKREVTELVEYIKKFKPTKIAIEAFPEWQATEKLVRYKAGEFREERDERFQLAIRVASELNLDTIYSIDAVSFDSEVKKLDSQYFEKLIKDFDFKSDDKFGRMYNDFSDYSGTLPSTVNLIDYFKYINSEEYHKSDFGAYLIGDFKLDNQRGADILSIWWYNRNLRIFRNLQQITESENDRIMVIIGNGHASILRQLLESSPEYEYVEFNLLE